METGHPPRPRLIARIGVTGHRPDRLAAADTEALRKEVRAVLASAAARLAALASEDASGRRPSFSAEPPLLRVVSSLAEGADRLAGREALALKAAAPGVEVELACPLPFFRRDFAGDFRPESAAEFESMLPGGRVLELDGTRADGGAEEAYEAAGRTVLEQSDLLIAVWDGREPRGRGGTGQIAAEAVRRGLPVVWVHAGGGPGAPPGHGACLLSWRGGPACGPPAGGLDVVLDGLLKPPAANASPEGGRDARPPGSTAPPAPPENGSEGAHLGYFAETQPRLTGGFLWAAFKGLWGRGRPGFPRLRVPGFLGSASRAWGDVPGAAAFQDALRELDRKLMPHFAWADGLADYYANLYRSSFLLNYLLGAFAVLLALMPFALGWTSEEHPMAHAAGWFSAAELALMLAILGNTLLGSRRRWHERWIDYRLLAEYLRQVRFLAPVCRVGKLGPGPGQPDPGDPRGTWMHWLACAAAREAGFVAARFDAAYLESCRGMLSGYISDQRSYHEGNARLLRAVDRRLGAAGLLLFTAALAACAAHLAVHSPWLTWAAAVFPAFGAALAGIRGHAELELIVRRSEAARAGLERLSRQLESLPSPPRSKALGSAAAAAADLMIEEALSWRRVSEARTLELSG